MVWLGFFGPVFHAPGGPHCAHDAAEEEEGDDEDGDVLVDGVGVGVYPEPVDEAEEDGEAEDAGGPGACAEAGGVPLFPVYVFHVASAPDHPRGAEDDDEK